MKNIVAKVSWNHAVGIYVDEEWITLTRIATSLFGTVILDKHSRKVNDGEIKSTLREVIDSALTPRDRKRIPVSVGIGAEMTFFATCILEDEQQGEYPSITTLLEASGATAAGEGNSVVADYIQIKAAGRKAYSVAACRKDLAGQIFEALNEAGIKQFRLEPAPYSLLAAAGRKVVSNGLGNVWRLRSGSSYPRRWKVYVHVLLDGQGISQPGTISDGTGNGLAILVVDGWPVLWRRFSILSGQEVGLISSTVRILLIHALRKIGIKSIKGIVLQAPIQDKDKVAELSEKITQESGINTIGIPLYLDTTGESTNNEANLSKTDIEEKGNSDASSHQQDIQKSDELQRPLDIGKIFGYLYSLGEALSIKSRPVSGSNFQIDIVSSLRPPPTLKDIFPKNLAVFMLIIIVAMAGMMWNKATSLDKQCRLLRKQNASHKWARSLSIREINKQRKALLYEVDCVYRFLGTRIVWSDYLRDIPTRLPPDACLVNVWANCEMKEMVKKKHARKPKKSLTLTAMARFSSRASAPREIDAFLQSLRGMKLLQRDFPLVELAEVKWRKEGKSGMALFTVIALPKTGKGRK